MSVVERTVLGVVVLCFLQATITAAAGRCSLCGSSNENDLEVSARGGLSSVVVDGKSRLCTLAELDGILGRIQDCPAAQAAARDICDCRPAYQEYSECDVCQGSLQIGFMNKMVTFTDGANFRDHSISCIDLEIEGVAEHIEDCGLARQLAVGECGCSTPAPVPAPVTIPPCNVCREDGLAVSSQSFYEAIWVENKRFSCLYLETLASSGFQHAFSPPSCEAAQTAAESCGCTKLAGPHPRCVVCHLGSNVVGTDFLSTEISVDGNTTTCGQAQELGRNGFLDEETCQRTGWVATSKCGCTTVTIGTSPTLPPFDAPVTFAPKTPTPTTPLSSIGTPSPNLFIAQEDASSNASGGEGGNDRSSSVVFFTKTTGFIGITGITGWLVWCFC